MSTVDPIAQRLFQPRKQVWTPAGLLFFLQVTAISTISGSIFGSHFEGLSSNTPFNLCFHCFLTRKSRRHESHCISTSKCSQIRSPPIVSKGLSFFLGEKLLIDLGLDKWQQCPSGAFIGLAFTFWFDDAHSRFRKALRSEMIHFSASRVPLPERWANFLGSPMFSTK